MKLAFLFLSAVVADEACSGHGNCDPPMPLCPANWDGIELYGKGEECEDAPFTRTDRPDGNTHRQACYPVGSPNPDGGRLLVRNSG